MLNSSGELANCRTMIDCTESLTETPRKDLEAAVASYSKLQKQAYS